MSETARELAQIYHASMMYIFEHQSLINSNTKNKSHLFGHLFINQVKEKYIDIYNRPFPTENTYIQKLLKLMKLVMEDNRSLLNDSYISYKGFIPAIFAFQLSEKFRERGYGIEIKFTNFPERIRNPKSKPDGWEQNALSTLQSNKSGYVLDTDVTYEGSPSTRYMRPVQLTPMCLSCHGSIDRNPLNKNRPQSEWSDIDVTGFRMEGWDLSELGGGISVVIYELNKPKYDDN